MGNLLNIFNIPEVEPLDKRTYYLVYRDDRNNFISVAKLTNVKTGEQYLRILKNINIVSWIFDTLIDEKDYELFIPLNNSNTIDDWLIKLRNEKDVRITNYRYLSSYYENHIDSFIEFLNTRRNYKFYLNSKDNLDHTAIKEFEKGSPKFID
jgi:hypothetical protein